MTTPVSPLAARVAYSFQDYYPGRWRNCFYLLIAINATSAISWFLFYRKFSQHSNSVGRFFPTPVEADAMKCRSADVQHVAPEEAG
jgi:hypothetical protein